MSFYGSSFTFNGKSCSEDFGLMMYDFNNENNAPSKFVSRELIEERIPNKLQTLFYGTNYKDPLVFTIIFGTKDPKAVLDREDMKIIADWLIINDGYKDFTINQDDMMDVKFKAIISDLEMVEHNGIKYAFKATVRCDSPYAYLKQSGSYVKSIHIGDSIVIQNPSNVDEPCYPVIEIKPDSTQMSKDIMMFNKDEDDRIFSLINLPDAIRKHTIKIDCLKGIITDSNGENIYKYCDSFKFPRLFKGENKLYISGDCRCTVTCEYQVNIGG